MKRNFKLKAIFAAGVLAALAVAPAQAVTVSVWNYSVSTNFLTGSTVFTPPDGNNDGVQVNAPLEISWGQSGGNLNPGGGRSGITIQNSAEGDDGKIETFYAAPGPIPPLPVGIDIGLGSFITHHNNPINSTFQTLDQTAIRSTLTLTPFAWNPPGEEPIPVPAVDPLTAEFTVYFLETPNVACTVSGTPSNNPCNDIFAFNTPQVFNQQLVYPDGGPTYYITLFPLTGDNLGSFTPLSRNDCTLAGAAPGCVGFTTVEGQATTVRFGFVVTTQPIPVIPLPGAVWLFGSALVGLATLARRRQMAA